MTLTSTPPSDPLRRRLCLGLALAGASIASPPVRADATWPRQMIRMVASGPPGSYSDSIARPLCDYLSQLLDKPVIVENRAGVNSSTGVGEAARASPNGHTIVITNSSSLTVNPQLYRKLSYSAKDLAPITPVLKGQFVLSVNPAWAKTHGIETALDLVKWARANPGKLRYASAGVGNLAHLAFAMLSKREDLDTTHIPYRGQSPAQLAVVSGEVEAMFDIASNTNNLTTGLSKALAITANERVAKLPDIPTMAEAGLPGYDISYWMGFLTTAGTPSATIERIHEVLLQAFDQPKIKVALALQGERFTESPDAFARRIEQEITLWGDIIRREKLVVD